MKNRLALAALFSLGASFAFAGEYAAPKSDSAKDVAASIAMSDIKGGSFTMGADPKDGFQNGFPAHTVNVKAFRMGKFEITFDQFDAFARATKRALTPDEGWGRGSRPVINVDWADISAFIAWLNKGTGRHFRLPSEAEWEYAARGGTTTLYWWGDDPGAGRANITGMAGIDTWENTAPVGQFPANAFGLYDVLGNVWEIVADCRHPDFVGAPVDGSAWMTGACDSHVVRGGFFGSIRRGMQVAAHAAAGQEWHSMGMGFRLAEAP